MNKVFQAILYEYVSTQFLFDFSASQAWSIISQLDYLWNWHAHFQYYETAPYSFGTVRKKWRATFITRFLYRSCSESTFLTWDQINEYAPSPTTLFSHLAPPPTTINHTHSSRIHGKIGRNKSTNAKSICTVPIKMSRWQQKRSLEFS